MSPIHEAAAKALTTFLGYQSGHAQNEAFSLPDDVAQAIAGHALHKQSAAEAIKDELSRLYDRRRDGHARDAAAEIAHQRTVIAARIVIEREEGCSPDESIEAVKLLTDEELAKVAAFPVDCSPQLDEVFERASKRVRAEVQILLDNPPTAAPEIDETLDGPKPIGDDKLEAGDQPE